MAVSTIDPNGLNIGQIGGTRNLIINGAMQVAQRGTSHSTAGYGSLDRWILSLSGGTATMSQETLTLGQTDIPSQFRNYMRINATAGNNYLGPYTKIENVYAVEGQVVLSFYAKGTNPGGGNFAIDIGQQFGSGGSAAVYTSLPAFSVTSSWQRYEISFTLPSLSGKTIGTGSFIEVYPHQPVGDTSTNAWTLDITGVQLEAGDTATPFEHRSYGQELALCQRYFFKLNTDGASTYSALAGAGWTSAYSYAPYPFPVTMRSSPSFALGGSVGNIIIMSSATQTPATGITLAGGTNKDTAELEINHGTITVGNSRWLRLTSGGSFSFDAEL